MAGQSLDLALRIKADLRQAIREVDRLEREIKQAGQAANTSGQQQRRLGRETDDYGRAARRAADYARRLNAEHERTDSAATRAVAGYARMAAQLAKLYAAYVLARQGAQLVWDAAASANDFRILQQRIERLGGSYAQIYDIAQDVNVPLETSVGLFQRLGMTRQTLGATTSEVETVTRAVLQLGRIGSSSQAEIESAAAQLGQAFGSTEAQWEDFGIIADSMPELLRRIEAGLGLLPGTIKQAVAEGMSMQDIFDALLKQAPEIAREFAEIPEEMRGASVSLGNAVRQFNKALDDALGTSKAITRALIAATDYLERFQRAEQRGADPTASPEQRLADIIASRAGRQRQRDQAQMELDEAMDPAGAAMLGLGPRALERRREELRERLADIDRTLGILDRAEAQARARLIEARTRTVPDRRDDIEGRGRGKKGIKDRSTPDIRAGLSRAGANVTAIVEAAAREAGIAPELLYAVWGLESNFGTNTRLRNATTGATGPFQLLPATAAQLGVPNVADASFRDQARAAARYVAQGSGDDTNRLLYYHGGPDQGIWGPNTRAYALAGMSSIDQYRGTQWQVDMDARTRAEADAARERERLGEQQARAAEQLAEREARAAEQAAEAEQRRRDGLHQSAESYRDLIDPVREYQRELDLLSELLREGVITQQEYAAAAGLIAAQLGEMQEGMQAQQEALSEFGVQAARNLQSTFAEVLFKPWEQGLDGMLVSFVDTLHRMAAELLAQRILMALFGGLGGGSGPLAGFGAALSGRVMHSGGMVGRDGMQRQAPAYLWAMAPRLHAGGTVGLRPGEVPAILERGERVLSRAEVAAGSGGQSVRIINTVDPAIAADYLGSAAGERTVLNIIRRNRGAVQQIVG